MSVWHDLVQSLQIHTVLELGVCSQLQKGPQQNSEGLNIYRVQAQTPILWGAEQYRSSRSLEAVLQHPAPSHSVQLGFTFPT